MTDVSQPTTYTGSLQCRTCPNQFVATAFDPLGIVDDAIAAGWDVPMNPVPKPPQCPTCKAAGK